MRTLALAAALAAALLVPAGVASAHCQIPCGIYDDHARVHAMLEDVTTIEKAVKTVTELAGKQDAQSVNQAARWVANKDRHADRIILTIAEYFLTQRVKPADPKDAEAWAAYTKRLTDHHAVMVLAMKTKQTVDPANVAALRAAVEKLEQYYPAK